MSETSDNERLGPYDRPSEAHPGDARLRIVVLVVTTGSIAFFSLVLGVLELVWSDPAAGWPTTMVGVLFILLIIDWFLRRETNLLGISAGLVVSILFLYFLIQGGIGGAGAVWAAVFPFFLPYLYGMRRGIAVNVLYLLAASAVLFILPAELHFISYPWLFKLNVLAAILASTVLGILAEYARSEALWERDAAIRALARAASTDHLTHLPNRRHMIEELGYAFKAKARFGEPFCVAIADLDHFKLVNDRCGHAVGDEVLRHTARLMKRSLRDVDLVARWGGEEFLILLPRTGLEEAVAVLERLRVEVARQVINTDAGPTAITLSVGVAEALPGMSIEVLEGVADRRLYAAKGAGRNRVIASDPAGTSELAEGNQKPAGGDTARR